MIRTLFRFVMLSFFALLILSIGSAIAAANAVAESGADEDVLSVTANDLKPNRCNGINLVSVFNLDGDGANNLVVGTAGSDTMRGRGGDDCVVGGGGSDNIRGNNDNDVLLGGAGNDTIRGNPGDDDIYGQAGNDTCIGGPGADTFSTCESVTP